MHIAPDRAMLADALAQFLVMQGWESWLVNGFGWILTFLLFPTGRLPSPRCRPVPWIGPAGTSAFSRPVTKKD